MLCALFNMHTFACAFSFAYASVTCICMFAHHVNGVQFHNTTHHEPSFYLTRPSLYMKAFISRIVTSMIRNYVLHIHQSFCWLIYEAGQGADVNMLRFAKPHLASTVALLSDIHVNQVTSMVRLHTDDTVHNYVRNEQRDRIQLRTTSFHQSMLSYVWNVRLHRYKCKRSIVRYHDKYNTY